MATIAYTIGYSTKTGALLMLPAVLGCLQYNHGTLTLIVCLGLIVAIQVGMALPFTYYGETSVADYI